MIKKTRFYIVFRNRKKIVLSNEKPKKFNRKLFSKEVNLGLEPKVPDMKPWLTSFILNFDVFENDAPLRTTAVEVYENLKTLIYQALANQPIKMVTHYVNIF